MHWMAPWQSKRQRGASPSFPKTSPSCNGSPPRTKIFAKHRKSKSKSDTARNRKEDKWAGSGLPSTDDAPWIIQNILVGAPLSETEWWEDRKSSDNGKEALNKANFATTNAALGTSVEKSIEAALCKKLFRNIGLKNWERGREKWRVPTVDKRMPPPAPVSRKQVIKGLNHPSRTFELPGPMTLTELVSTYIEIWERE